MAANIISYNKLRETHNVHYDDDLNIFTAVPFVGPTLVFRCVEGHYIMDFVPTVQIYMSTINERSHRCFVRQVASARKAYDFLIRMGYLSYKAAAEMVQRGSIKGLQFTRADLINAEDIYGTSATYILGQGTHLGMHWDFSIYGEVTLCMDGYMKNIFSKYNITKFAKRPATDQLFQYNLDCKLLSISKQAEFHSLVLELHYLAKRIEGDILCAVSYCATRILTPNEDDKMKLYRILHYLNFTGILNEPIS